MESKKRGRPPLPEDVKRARQAERNRRNNERKKQNGWIAEKKYAATHPEIKAKKYANWSEKYYSPKINIPREFKPTFDTLLASTGKTISELVLEAVEEKYSVTLRGKKDDKTDNDTGE